jgi:hypothetical protein
VAEPVGRSARVLGEQGAVDRADRAADNQVRHQADLRQRLQHPDLDSAEAGTAAEHEGDRRGQLDRGGS